MSLHDEVNRMVAGLSPTEMKVFRQRFPNIDFDKPFEEQAATLEDLGEAGRKLKERFERTLSPRENEVLRQRSQGEWADGGIFSRRDG